MRPSSRWAIALILLSLPPVGILVSGLLWRDAMPEQVATHWSDLGAADGSAPTRVVFLMTLAVAGAVAIAGTVTVAVPCLRRRATRAILFWLGVPAGLAAACWLIPAWLTLRAGSPEGAVLGIWIIPLVVCVLAGAAPYAIAPPPGGADAALVPGMPLAPGEVGAWSRTVTANVFVYATIALLVIAGIVYVPLLLSSRLGAVWPGLVVLVTVSLVTAAFMRLRVTVDWRGLRIISVPLGIPLMRIPLNRVRHAEAAHLRPGEWGGWGYRIMPGRSALILRGGPGLIVTRTNDRLFAITLADPEIPAGLLNTLRAQEATPERLA
ncbi:hypothetical protein [Microbacterium sp. SORGH_AS_0888]|uniref:hypothetical protein n=1 Tax=Microbacterium sp. SORGH_AS_0888 TaxID=3041791 RepID=UPI00277EA3C5|nr:hypothetical protein [Microbacterium sp. SORGH_AS_0888]MDQ1128241.1 hypothetical protein [Microbacterium sp. SORGH_AS_0888]